MGQPDKRIRPAGNRTDSKIDGETIGTSVGDRADGSPQPVPFQPMPELSPEQFDALRADIETNGVVVPVVVDQHGRTLDGHNRRRIADELGIECPVEVRHVANDNEAADLAVILNCARRHLTQEQKRDLIREELFRRWGDSDRAIARRVGSSPSTVGSIRFCVRQDAERSVQEVREGLAKARDSLLAQAMMMHRGIDYKNAYSWQSTGDILERLWHDEVPGLSNLDTEHDELDAWMASLADGWFDSIRAFVLDCDPDCPTCTPADREWAEKHPRQVWRHSEPDVSNLDTTSAGGVR